MVRLSHNRWLALMVLAAAQFVVIMDTSIIGVALPDIGRTLGFSQASLSMAQPHQPVALPASSWAVP